MGIIMLALLLALFILLINALTRKSKRRVEQEDRAEAERLKRIARIMAEPEDHDKETPRSFK
jgi:uncharacterized membrane protein YhiD involved in acid resistance